MAYGIPNTALTGLAALGPGFPWAALASLGLPLLSRLFGEDNAVKLQKQISEIMSAKAIGGMANQFQDQWYKSPAYSETQRQSMAAGAAASEGVSRAGAGVTSGLDMLRSGAAAGVGSATLARANASAYMRNLEMALGASQHRASALAGMGPAPNYGRELFGAGVSFLGPLFAKYYGARWGTEGTR